MRRRDTPPPDTDPHPKTVDEFKAAVQKVLDDTGVPGAGIALVRLNGVEWAGGVGLADRDARTPVTADTHFRAGSISKTFIAAALVQMYEDGEIDLNAPVVELASDVQIDNAWMIDDPVRLIHLLQHTAGFDDMHFNEMYNVSHPPDLPLVDVLRLNPGVARGAMAAGHAHVVFESRLRASRATSSRRSPAKSTRIASPSTSSSRVGMTEEQLRPDRSRSCPKLAKGYASRTGPPVAVHADLPAAVRQPAHDGR